MRHGVDNESCCRILPRDEHSGTAQIRNRSVPEWGPGTGSVQSQLAVDMAANIGSILSQEPEP